MSDTIPRCPRCHGPMPHAGGSRATPEREIDVCGPCDGDEAYRESYGDGLQPVAAWPVQLTYDALGERLPDSPGDLDG